MEERRRAATRRLLGPQRERIMRCAVSEGNLAVVRKLFAAWERGDFDTAYAFDPHVEFARIGGEQPVGAGEGEWRGIDEMWAACVEWLSSWENVRVEAERLVDLGDSVLVLSRQIGHGKHSGLPLNNEMGDLFTVRDGKIVRWELYIDRAEALQAAGLEE